MRLGDTEMHGLSTPGGDGTREGVTPHVLWVLVGLEHPPLPPWGLPHSPLLQAQKLDLTLEGPD